MIMKKLVTALALCASFSAFAQVESANIVGYNNTTGENGASVYTPMFIPVGGGNATLGDIKGNFVEWTDTIQILDSSLAATTIYTWIDVTYASNPPVWTSNGTTDDSNVVVPRGAAVVISSSAATLLNAGQVQTGTTQITCGTGATVLGNPVPKAITLGSIGFTDLVEWTDTIQMLDNTLAATIIYTWIDITYASNPPVWTSNGTTDDSGVVLAPGAGFVLSSANGSTVTFPAAM